MAVEPPIPPKEAPKVSEHVIKEMCDLLYVGHAMLAQYVKVDELKLDHKEARDLAAAISNVTRHYQWSPISEKTKDWLILIGCVGVTYDKRWKAVKTKIPRGPFRRKQPQPQQDFPFPDVMTAQTPQ